jgi:hypothetical protein
MNQHDNIIVKKIEELQAKASEEMFQTITAYLSQNPDTNDTSKNSTSQNI